MEIVTIIICCICGILTIAGIYCICMPESQTRAYVGMLFITVAVMVAIIAIMCEENRSLWERMVLVINTVLVIPVISLAIIPLTPFFPFRYVEHTLKNLKSPAFVISKDLKKVLWMNDEGKVFYDMNDQPDEKFKKGQIFVNEVIEKTRYLYNDEKEFENAKKLTNEIIEEIKRQKLRYKNLPPKLFAGKKGMFALITQVWAVNFGKCPTSPQYYLVFVAKIDWEDEGSFEQFRVDVNKV